jgi:hypothetical protein
MIWAAFAVIALIVVPVAIDSVCLRFLQRLGREFRQDAADIRRQEKDYRRPFVIDDPIDQNAAGFYREAFPLFSVWLPDNAAVLRQAAARGVDRYPNDDSDLRRRCAATGSPAVQMALRSTSCDWERGFGIDEYDPTRFEQEVEAFSLASCLTVEGHRLARDNGSSAAARSYFEALAVGCDLGMRDPRMCIDGEVVSLAALNGLGRLIASTDDNSLLDGIERQLSRFEMRLPDYRLPLRHFVVWEQNANSIDQLAHDGRRFEKGILAPTMMRVWSTYRILRHDGDMRDLGRFAAIASREEGTTLLAKGTRIGRRGTNEFSNADQLEDDVHGRFNLTDTYRATQLAIQLQRWRVAHDTYPRDLSSVAEVDGVRGLHYTVTANGRGYKLTGYRDFSLVAVPERE